jgi:hypothetical protein
MDLIMVDLKRAFEQSGCPICRLRRRTARRYLHSLLWENVNDPGTRAHLVRALGFCHAHAWQLQQMEKSLWGGGLGTGIIYEDLATRALAGLEAYVNAWEPAPDRPHRWRRCVRRFGKLWKRWLWRPVAVHPDGALPPGLAPQQRCRACEITDSSERTNLAWLVKSCAQTEFREWYRASDGLCLPHLRQALALAEREDPAVALFLAQTGYEKLTRLTMQLREYIRKHAWEYRDEPKLPEEQSSWVRAVAFFAGERWEALGEVRGPFGEEP